MAQVTQPYEHQEFPKMLYSASGANQIAHNEDEFAELQADGWTESPADHGFVETVDPAERRRQQLAKDRADRESKVRAQREEQARQDAEAKARADAEAKAKADAEGKSKK